MTYIGLKKNLLKEESPADHCVYEYMALYPSDKAMSLFSLFHSLYPAVPYFVGILLTQACFHEKWKGPQN